MTNSKYPIDDKSEFLPSDRRRSEAYIAAREAREAREERELKARRARQDSTSANSYSSNYEYEGEVNFDPQHFPHRRVGGGEMWLNNGGLGIWLFVFILAIMGIIILLKSYGLVS